MVEYSKLNVTLTDRQLNQLKTVAKDKTGITLGMNWKCLTEMICLMNYYWQQDKKRSSKMNLITICQPTLNFLKSNFLKKFSLEGF